MVVDCTTFWVRKYMQNGNLIERKYKSRREGDGFYFLNELASCCQWFGGLEDETSLLETEVFCRFKCQDEAARMSVPRQPRARTDPLS